MHCWLKWLVVVHTTALVLWCVLWLTMTASNAWVINIHSTTNTKQLYFDKPSDGKPPCWIILVSNAIAIMKASLETALEPSVSVISQLLMSDVIDDVTTVDIWNLLKQLDFNGSIFINLRPVVYVITSNHQWYFSMVNIRGAMFFSLTAAGNCA